MKDNPYKTTTTNLGVGLQPNPYYCICFIFVILTPFVIVLPIFLGIEFLIRYFHLINIWIEFIIQMVGFFISIPLMSLFANFTVGPIGEKADKIYFRNLSIKNGYYYSREFLNEN